MKRSTDRILTTHMGSLPRPDVLAVEHPLVIAEQLERAVRAVGDRERVMAGTDCGFGTIVGDTQVSEDVVWAKPEAMRDGAAMASQRLWRRGGNRRVITSR